MAKRKTNQGRRTRRPESEEAPSMEFSLEEILTEYRLSQQAEEEALARESVPEAEPLRLAEEDGILAGAIPEEPSGAGEGEDSLETDIPAPEEDTPGLPEEEPIPTEEIVPEIREDAVEEKPILSETEEDAIGELFTPEELVPREEMTDKDASLVIPVEEEGFVDEDLYAAVHPETTAPDEEDIPLSVEDDAREDSGEEPGEEGDAADASRPGEKPAHRQRRPGGSGKLWSRLTGLLAAASFRREQQRRQTPAEPENKEPEMAPDKAARYYASQMPALRLRSYGALGVCLLLTWLTVGSGLGGGLPGRLATDIRLASMVALVGQITVLILALDVVTAGIMSFFRGRPRAESLLVLASLATIVDTVVIIITKNDYRGIPFGAVTSLGLFFALRGGWHSARAFHDTFFALFQNPEPNGVVQETPEKNEKVLVRVERETAGFVSRSEEPGESEILSSIAFFPMLVVCIGLSLAISVGSGDIGAFFHIFAMMTALCAGFGWLYSCPLLFSRVARHLMRQGSAMAGWSGARDMGSSRRLVISDTDIFPEDTLEIVGIRVLDKAKAQDVIACTGTLLTAAGTGTARVFTELMRRHKAAVQTLEDFSVGEGGCKGIIQYQEVRVGSLGYMHLSGVKIPDKLREENALYTAVGGELAGVFLFRYHPIASVQRGLYTLRRQHRKPIFAVRDFNLDPLLLQRSFGVSTEGFVFPPCPERYRLSIALSDSKRPLAGVMARDGLDLMVDLTESGIRLYQLGRLCAWIPLACAVLGMALMISPCWLGNWAAASAWRVLVYLLLWLLPTMVSWLLLRK